MTWRQSSRRLVEWSLLTGHTPPATALSGNTYTFPFPRMRVLNCDPATLTNLRVGEPANRRARDDGRQESSTVTANRTGTDTTVVTRVASRASITACS